ncbi:hypothetical protein Emed_004340 [Eimeria media]
MEAPTATSSSSNSSSSSSNSNSNSSSSSNSSSNSSNNSSSSSSAAGGPAALCVPEEGGVAAERSSKKSPKNLLEGNHVRWSAAASGTAALLTCCMLHPLDLIKTRMQVAAITQGAIPRYPSTSTAVRLIFQQQGLKGLWQGVGVTAAASAASWTCFRYAFDSLSLRCPRWRATILGGEETQRSWLDDVASGLVSGVVVTGLTHPLWLAKARMEMQAKETQLAGWPRFRNGFDCIVSAARGGWKESYRGIGPALALTPHVAIQIAVYEHLKEQASAAAAAVAAAAATLVLLLLLLRLLLLCSPISMAAAAAAGAAAALAGGSVSSVLAAGVECVSTVYG